MAARAMSFSLSSPPSSGDQHVWQRLGGLRLENVYLMITATPGHDDEVENPDGCCLDQLGKRGRDAPERDHLGHDNHEALDQRCVDAPGSPLAEASSCPAWSSRHPAMVPNCRVGQHHPRWGDLKPRLPVNVRATFRCASLLQTLQGGL